MIENQFKILSKLRIHKNINLLVEIKFNTTYQKNVVAKNLAGKAEEYQLEAKTNYTIIINELEKIIVL